MSSVGVSNGSTIAVVGVAGVAVAAWWWFLGGASPSGSSSTTTLPSLDKTKKADGAVRERPDITVLYGSMSGTSRDLARAFAHSATRKGLKVKVIDCFKLAPVEPSTPHDEIAESVFGTNVGKVVVLVQATYGEGDPTDTAAALLKTLEDRSRRKAARDLRPLAPFAVSVFGLGDSSYKYFCRAGTRFHTACEKLGASMLLPCAMADVMKDMEGTFEAWQEALWDPVAAATGVKLADDTHITPVPELEFAFCDESVLPAATPFPKPASGLPASAQTPVTAVITSVRSLLLADTPPDGVPSRPTVEVEVDVSGAMCLNNPGDHLAVLPHNPPAQVERCLDLLGVSAADRDRVVELTTPARNNRRASPANTLPARIQLRAAFRYYVALTTPVRRATIRVLAAYVEDEAEKARLLGGISSAAAFAEFCAAHRHLVAVLEAFPGARATPLGHLMESLPPVAPRLYSIASDGRDSRHIRLCVVQSDAGLCSTWLTSEVKVGDVCTCFVRRTTFSLPPTIGKTYPVVLVCAGTGIAPFIGFFEQRERELKAGKTLAPATLFFGCRSEKFDFLYKDRLLAWAETPVLTELVPAFSRDGTEKVYVQDRIKERAEELWDLLHRQRATLYVCGDAKGMARGVDDAIVEHVVQGAGGLAPHMAKDFVASMERDLKYMKDVWTS